MLGQEERCRDLAIRVALGDQVSDPPLTFGQLAARRSSSADARELGAGLLRPERCADALELYERLLERRARSTAFLGTTLRSAESKQSKLASAPSVSPRAASSRPLHRARIASAHARLTPSARGCQKARISCAS